MPLRHPRILHVGSSSPKSRTPLDCDAALRNKLRMANADGPEGLLQVPLQRETMYRRVMTTPLTMLWWRPQARLGSRRRALPRRWLARAQPRWGPPCSPCAAAAGLQRGPPPLTRARSTACRSAPKTQAPNAVAARKQMPSRCFEHGRKKGSQGQSVSRRALKTDQNQCNAV